MQAMRLNTGMLRKGAEPLPDWKRIPAEGMFLKPGETAFTIVNGVPVILAFAGEIMLVAHTSETGIIDHIVKCFGECGIKPIDIRMEIDLHAPGQERAFVERAAEAGLRHVWATEPGCITTFLPAASATHGEGSIVTIEWNR